MGKKTYIDGPFGQIHVESFGSGTPIILHHQAPADRRQFYRAAPLLADRGFHVIMPDTPGFGMSDRPDHPPSVEELAAVTGVLIDAFDLDETVVLGHHTGAMIATEAALRFSDQISAVILNGPLPMTEEEAANWTAGPLQFEKNWRIKADGSHMIEVWNYISEFAEGASDTESLHWMNLAAMQAGEQFWYGHGACFAYDHTTTLKKLAQTGKPTLVLTNTGDVCFPFAQRTMELCPSFHYTELSGGTLDFANENPDQWCAAICQFLTAP